ncbi:bis(5'-nucleosyl)-tetraphosphatase (symmetrical) YqeK [Bhargavaea beijingensis]|uniref:bis(5'-nucleosyl)-tetraphosphatase (symmetrical) n=1 Tax=Bhargavaea beijingensis TaxID=426756 RepID=A0ABX9ZBN4_9BACL|nr:bis(5'-nucleosyl)-tetraphosphatase (symmetrical) YqeK [Bhargavaea beijingensis]MCW1927057.1 bis(5'-nucleosyl)-tetraphosphatase (symmetrical) YqeK [Bhargavaea beijingensis]RSK30787.1 HD domain-containing protein [Bhargavaea beijingensis]
MESEQLKNEVGRRLPSGRYQHVLRVTGTAMILADRFGEDKEKAETAALLHDVAKAMTKEELKRIVESEGDPAGVLGFHHELWHGPAGAAIAREEFGIRDAEILAAVRFHTTGRAGMSCLEKIIFVADMIEPGRAFPGIEGLRAEAERSLDSALVACSAHNLQYLASVRAAIHPDTLRCYNDSLS